MFDSLKAQALFPTPPWVADIEPAKAARRNRDLVLFRRLLEQVNPDRR